MSETETSGIFEDTASVNGNSDDNVFVSEEKTPQAPQETTPSERKPVKNEPRSSASNLIAMAWGGVGMALVQSGTDIPVGRVLQFQAPLAGNKFDELLRDTWLDHVLQPFIKGAETVEGLGAIIMFPLLVGAYERNPSIAPFAEGILREIVSTTLVEMAPVIKAKQTKDRRAANAMKEVNEMFDIPKGADPIDAILASIFAMPETPMEGNNDEPS